MTPVIFFQKPLPFFEKRSGQRLQSHLRQIKPGQIKGFLRRRLHGLQKRLCQTPGSGLPAADATIDQQNFCLIFVHLLSSFPFL